MRLGYFDKATQESVSSVINNFSDIPPRTLGAISKFNWLWPCFESKKCETKANAERLNSFATAESVCDLLSLSPYVQASNYFRQRYNDEAWRLDQLAGTADDRNIIQQGISAEASDQQISKALCRIVFRLRNNLFHGTKGQDNLINQHDNFIAANVLLRHWIMS